MGAALSTVPVLFHAVHGSNITVEADGRQARRTRPTQPYDAVCYSHRTIAVDEQIHLRINATTDSFKDQIRFGYTSTDPSSLGSDGVPASLIGGEDFLLTHWLTLLPPEYGEQDSHIFFYVNDEGYVRYGVEGFEIGNLAEDIPLDEPLWAVVEVCAQTTSIEISTPVIVDTTIRGKKSERKEENYVVRTERVPIQIPQSRFLIGEKLGEGSFGEVFQGQMTDDDGKAVLVAIKKLKRTVDEGAAADLEEEVKMMASIKPHANVVRLYGAHLDQSPMLVVEFVHHGSLHSFLRDNKDGESDINLNPVKLTHFALDCAQGLQHITETGIIHRDLAARNVLVSEKLICKLCDFGFAKKTAVHLNPSDAKVPIRWMPPETFDMDVFVVKSDVWSFGILLWEIYSNGDTPYGVWLPNKLIMRNINNNERLAKPVGCPSDIYELMTKCWYRRPRDRPDISDLTKAIELLFFAMDKEKAARDVRQLFERYVDKLAKEDDD